MEKPGSWYHLSARGIERKDVYRDDQNRRRFLELIANKVARYRIHPHANMLIDNR